MKLIWNTAVGRRTSERGYATVVVLVLLALIGVLLVQNALTLRQLKRELQLIEQQQLQRLPVRAPANPRAVQE